MCSTHEQTRHILSRAGHTAVKQSTSVQPGALGVPSPGQPRRCRHQGRPEVAPRPAEAATPGAAGAGRTARTATAATAPRGSRTRRPVARHSSPLASTTDSALGSRMCGAAGLAFIAWCGVARQPAMQSAIRTWFTVPVDSPDGIKAARTRLHAIEDVNRALRKTKLRKWRRRRRADEVASITHQHLCTASAKGNGWTHAASGRRSSLAWHQCQ